MKNLISFLSILTLLSVSSLNAQDESCSTESCHKGISKHEFEHPAMEDGCMTCHEEDKSNHPGRKGDEFVLTEELPSLCYECHDAPEENLNIHGAVENGDCTTCHNPHGSDFETILKDENPGNLCFECHDVDEGKDIIKHGPVISRQCIACHAPHASELPTLLRKEPPELCFMCHVDKKEKLKMETVHGAFEGSCTDCHTPHQATVKYLIKKKAPELCYDCHDSDKLNKERTTEATDFRNGDKNLHFFHISKNKGRNCTMCHEVHGSKKPHLIAKKVQFG